MYLSEEYFLRNNIDVPLVKHSRSAHCFIKTNFWQLLDISWYQEVGRVGYYNIQYIEPSCNGFKTECQQSNFVVWNKAHSDVMAERDRLSYFAPIPLPWSNLKKFVPTSVYYDDYEDYILFFSSFFSDAASDEQEVLIAVWEMFLRSLDDNIVHYNLFDKLSHSLCFDGSKIDRFQIILENIEYLHSNNLEIYNKWKNNFLPYAGDYSFWLAKLLKDLKSR